MNDTVGQLRAMHRIHGDTPLGNRLANLARKLKARSECQGSPRALEIDRNIRRDLEEIAALQGR